MPIYKAFILNKEINVNYVENEKEKLIETIKLINSKLESYDQKNGKISDTKLLSFLAIKLQAEILDLNKSSDNELKLEKRIEEINIKNIDLNDKFLKLSGQNQQLKKENILINQELIKLQNQIELIIELIKKTYDEQP